MTAEQSPRPGVPADGFAERRVLVIDDDPAVTAAMEVLFQTWGAAVIAAPDLAHATDALGAFDDAGHGLDLIVADLRLAEGASGLDAIASLRRSLGERVPALIVSGDTSEAARDEVAREGIALLQKPVVASALHAAARRALHEASTITEAREQRAQEAVSLPLTSGAHAVLR